MKTYKESQKFSPTIFFILVLICLLVCGVAIWQVSSGQKVGNRPAPNPLNIFLSFFVCLLTVAFWYVRLQTEITDQSIKYGFKFILSYGGDILWSDVRQIQFIRFPYLGEGIRMYSDENAWAYVTQNDHNLGILIERKDNKGNILISTTQMPALKDFVKSLSPAGVEIIEE